MPQPIDILRLLPEVATIGREKLQIYCDEWLQRPIAQEYGVTHLIVGSDCMLTVNLDETRARFVGGRIFIPIDELADYIIDRHFTDADKRQELHAQMRELRKGWNQIGYQYLAMSGRVGRLWIACKNPACDVSMETSQEAVEGQSISCPPFSLNCPVCGHTDTYDGSDLYLRFDDK